jgi:hypothetical protein
MKKGLQYRLKKICQKFKSIVIAFILVSISITANAQIKQYNFESLFQEAYKHSFHNLIPLKQYWLNLSLSKRLTDLTPLSYGLDALQAMFQTTNSTIYLDDAIVLINNVLQRSKISDEIPGNSFKLKDKYKSWIAEIPGEQSYELEDPLSESYFFQYVTKLLRDISLNRNVFNEKKYQLFYYHTLNFIETNVWDKWESRGLRLGDKYVYILRSRTHMASHWAYIAADLSVLTTSLSRKLDYRNVVNLYNANLENNFVKYNQYILWNSTWNKSFSITDDTARIIQDVAHGNQVVAYLIEAYELQLWKDSGSIVRLVNTVKEKLWNPANCTFKDNIDGSTFDSLESKNSSSGSFQAAGFVKLARFDRSLFSIYEKFIACSKYLTFWYQYGELFANLALSNKLFKSEKVLY